MGGKPSTTVLIGRLAGETHGVVTRKRLLSAGVTSREIERRLANGALLREHRGVYRVGHRAPSVEARYLAAVFACGEQARLSGRAAGSLYGLLRRGSAPPPEVTTPSQRVVRGIAIRRSPGIALDATRLRGIPVTTVARTLVDLAAVLSRYELARACHEAGVFLPRVEF